MVKMNGGTAVVECLRKEKVRYAFGIIGSSYLEILDAFYDPTDIDFISVRHEQAAAHMADVYARVTNGIGVCLAQGGPGASNLVTGVALAKLAYSPVLAISGATMTNHDQRDSFQEIDQLSLFRPITKAALRIARADRTAELTQHAIRTALSGQRGPVFVEMPRDVLNHETEQVILEPARYRAQTPSGANPTAVSDAITLLRQAKAPLIIAGSGVKWSRSSKQLLELVEALNVPFVTSNGNRDLVPNNHRLFFGQLGPRGSTIARDLAQKADVIFALGSRLSFTTAFFNYAYINQQAKLIQSDIEPKEIGRLYPVTIGIVGDAAEVIRACLLETTKHKAISESNDWHQWVLQRRKEWQAERSAGLQQPAVPVRTPRFYAELRKAVPTNIHVTVDAGYWGNMATDAFDHFECPSLFTPLEYGCLGFSFPAALGVKFAKPDAPVISINGDGGFAMNMQELETAVRCKLNPVILVLNNFSWGVEKSYQKDFFDKRYVGANIGNPRFDKLAEAFGARGLRVERSDEIAEAVVAALKSDLPTVIDVMADSNEIFGLRRDAVVARKPT